VVTGVRRGELCGLQIRNIDLDGGLVHVAFNYVVRRGQRVRKDTKTHQDRWLAVDQDTCKLITSYLDEIGTAPAGRQQLPQLTSSQAIHYNLVSGAE
jgi:integrase